MPASSTTAWALSQFESLIAPPGVISSTSTLSNPRLTSTRMCTCPTQRRPPLPPSRPPHPSKSEAVTTSTHVISTKFLRICRFLSCLQLAFPRRCHLANRPSSLPTPGPAAHKCRHHHHQHVYCPGRYYPSILTTYATSACVNHHHPSPYPVPTVLSAPRHLPVQLPYPTHFPVALLPLS